VTGEHPLTLEGITHRYGEVTALEDVSLEIEHGELITLLGPSGCGKTTLLRILAGFIRPTAGRVILQGQDVTRVPPHKRPVNMVFQRAALFPHLDVMENVAFGLRVARVGRDEVAERVAETLRLVRLEGFERRRAHELSGGQMSRVALARALVNRPRVLLLDEPLSALDLKIRLEMEVELRRVHRETGATFVYVTHDQREALALSDRIVVFNHGRMEQVGTPDEIYRRPASPFAARFVGDANVLPVEVVEHGDGRATVLLAGRELVVPCDDGARTGSGWLVVRPEVVRVGPDVDDVDAVRGVVRDLAFRGSGHSYRIEVDGLPELLKAEVASEHGAPVGIGGSVNVTWDAGACRLLPREGNDDYHHTVATSDMRDTRDTHAPRV
jgi:spermidine/putrescine ABC transporter ATP-binding subunit